MSLKRKRQSYDVSYKLKVVNFAESASNCAAEREFGVSEKMVRDWRKKKSVLLDTTKTMKKIRPSIRPYAALEEKVLTWVNGQREKGLIVNRATIRLKALLYSREKEFNIQPGKFHASAGWCTRFMDRNDLSLRQRTHIAQKLPKDIEVKVDSFHQFIIKERKMYDYELGHIGNMDETPMTFDIPSNSTVNRRGEKTITIRTCGSEKTHFTVVLSCMADGTKLKPMVIFKRKTLPKEKLPAGVLVTVHPKGWMDESLVGTWLEKVWDCRPGALARKRALLVWDMFRAHLTDGVKARLKRLNTRQAVIPGGATSILQPLDVSLNKPFKTHMKRQWMEWMTDGPHLETKAGNLKRASIADVCGWVVSAWREIPREMVRKSFLKCGIANSMDGSEDDELFNDFLQSSREECVAADPDPAPESDDDDDNYTVTEKMTEDDFHELFGHSDDEPDFDGF